MKMSWVLFAGLLVTTNVTAQNQDQAAVLGNSAGGGGGGRGDPATELVLQRAMDTAKQSGRVSPTVEQLLLALLDDQSVKDALAGQSVDRSSLQALLQSHVQTVNASRADAGLDAAAPDDANGPGSNPPVRNVLRRALMKNMALNRKSASPTDFLVAILVEGDTFAAKALAEHGLTVDEAESASMERYLAATKEQDARYENLQRQIAAESARLRDPSAPQIVSNQSSSGPPRGPNSYSLRVTSGGAEETRFKGAVSHDGRLDLYIESTPFEIEFAASRIAALFEGIDGRLKVELSAEVDGERRVVSGFGGESGAIFDDVPERGQRSGTLR